MSAATTSKGSPHVERPQGRYTADTKATGSGLPLGAQIQYRIGNTCGDNLAMCIGVVTAGTSGIDKASTGGTNAWGRQ